MASMPRPLGAIEEIADFLDRPLSRRSYCDSDPHPRRRLRAEELLEKLKDGCRSVDERAELDHFEQVERLMRFVIAESRLRKIGGHEPASFRRLASFIQARAHGRCEYCLIHEDDSHFPHQPDHVVAQKHRGPTHEDNLAWACYLCNLLKGSDIASVDIESGRSLSPFQPAIGQWADHFRLRRMAVVPLTPIGRVTEYLLQFIHTQAVQDRRWLVEARRYPR